MIESFKESHEEFKDYDSELLLKIINSTSVEIKKNDDKELFVDENWKINSNNISHLKRNGFKKVALVSQLMNSEDPKEDAIMILKKLSNEN